MAKKVNIGQLSDAVMDILDSYQEQVEAMLTDEIEDISKEGTKKLKTESPKNRGTFAKSWRRRVDNKYTNHPTAVLYNTKYPLTHLLENGHVMVLFGNRTNDFVEGKHFIAPINDWIQDEFVGNVQMRISKGLK